MNVLMNFLEDDMYKERDVDMFALFTVKEAIDILTEQLNTKIVLKTEDGDVSLSLDEAYDFVNDNIVENIYIEGYIDEECTSDEAIDILDDYKEFLGV